MNIKILGSGCSNCNNLEKITHQVVKELNISAEFSKESDFSKIASYGVMKTPALVINEKVVLTGRVPSKNELKEIISKYV